MEGERLAYLGDRLVAGNRLRVCFILFLILLVPWTVVRGFEGSLDMIVTATIIALVLRNVDPLFKPSSIAPSQSIVFIVPAALILALGSLFDATSLVQLVIWGDIHFWLISLHFVSLASRVSAAKILLPLARMVLDPSFSPHATGSLQSQGLLLRAAADNTLNRVEFAQVALQPSSSE